MNRGGSLTQGGGREATLPWASVLLPLRGARLKRVQATPVGQPAIRQIGQLRYGKASAGPPPRCSPLFAAPAKVPTG
jgi:hypothetical protein